VSSAVYGGNQAAAIAGASAQDMARTRALGTFESQLAQQDIQAKQAGAEQLGKLQSSQLQIQGQRDAYTQQVNAEYEAEVDSRRRQLGTSLVNFGVQAAGGPGEIGKKLGGAFSDMKAKAGVMKQMFSLTPESIPEMEQLKPNWNMFAGISRVTPSITPLDAIRLGNMPAQEGETSLSNSLTNPRAIPRFGSANPLPNVSQFGRESLALADAFLSRPTQTDAFGNVTDGFPTDWDDAPATTTQVPGQLPAGLGLEEWQKARQQQFLDQMEQQRVERLEKGRSGLSWLMNQATMNNPLLNAWSPTRSEYQRYRQGQ
jgi:hypothetical protein